MYLDDFLATGKEGDQAPQLEFEQLPFSHPLFIMYSSGTTGSPKCMVHSAGVRYCSLSDTHARVWLLGQTSSVHSSVIHITLNVQQTLEHKVGFQTEITLQKKCQTKATVLHCRVTV